MSQKRAPLPKKASPAPALKKASPAPAVTTPPAPPAAKRAFATPASKRPFAIPASKRPFAIPASKRPFTIPASKAQPPIRSKAAKLVGPITIESGQRDKARDVVSTSPPGSVGAAIHDMLTRFDVRLVGNYAAGTVGDFYEQVKSELLDKPATPENIMEFARRETDFFNNQSDAAGYWGSKLTAEDRACMIQTSAIYGCLFGWEQFTGDTGGQEKSWGTNIDGTARTPNDRVGEAFSINEPPGLGGA